MTYDPELVERVAARIEDQMASDDNMPEDIAKAALSAAFEWKSIESAPRDGSVILLLDMNEYTPKVVAGFYCSREGYPWIFLDPKTEDHLNGWNDDRTGPTHWMPPTSSAGDER